MPFMPWSTMLTMRPTGFSLEVDKKGAMTPMGRVLIWMIWGQKFEQRLCQAGNPPDVERCKLCSAYREASGCADFGGLFSTDSSGPYRQESCLCRLPCCHICSLTFITGHSPSSVTPSFPAFGGACIVHFRTFRTFESKPSLSP
jgi:hypothetical protein